MVHLLEPGRRRRLARPRRRGRAVVDAARPAAHAHPVVVGLGEVVAAVGADADMVDAHDVDRLGDHLAPVPERAAVVVAGDVAIGGAAQHAALLGQHLQHVVGLVALVREQAVGIGVRHRDRLLGMDDRVLGRAIADMAEVDQDAGAVHLAHDFLAGARQARILVLVAAAAQLILVVVGELDRAHAQLGEQLDEADAALQQVGVLEAEQDGGATRGDDRLDLLRRRGDRHQVLVGVHQVAPAGDRIEQFDRALPEPAGHRHRADIGLAQLAEGVAGEVAALQTVDQHGVLLVFGLRDWRRTRLAGTTRRLAEAAPLKNSPTARAIASASSDTVVIDGREKVPQPRPPKPITRRRRESRSPRSAAAAMQPERQLVARRHDGAEASPLASASDIAW